MDRYKWVGKLLILLLLVALARPAAAQTMEDRINAILLDETMLSGLGQGATPDEAYQAALRELTIAVSDYRLSHGAAAVIPSDLQPIVEKLDNTLINPMETLLYLPIARAMALRTHDSMGVQVGATPAPAPVQQQAAADTVAVPVAPVTVPEQTVAADAAAPNEVAEYLAAFQPLQLDELGRLLTSLRGEGRVADFGQSGADRAVPDGACVVIVGRDYQVKAILSPRSVPRRINYLNGNEDNETNYHDFGIIWFK